MKDVWETEKASDSKQQAELVKSLDFFLTMDDEHHNSESQEVMLYVYNLLRERAGLAGISNSSEIDRLWFEDQHFEQWKMSLDLADLSYVTKELINLYDDLADEGNDSLLEKKVLFLYNYMCVGEPSITSIEEIDSDTIDDLDMESDYYDLIIKYQYGIPSVVQLELAQDALKYTSLKEKNIFVTSTCDGNGYATERNIALPQSDDLDVMLFTLYHELGHMYYNDRANELKVASGKLAYRDLIDDAQFLADCARIDHYCELGKTAFDSSTKLGRRINHVLQKYPTFYSPPSEDDKLLMSTYHRGREKHADLFALEKLYEQGKLQALLHRIAWWAFSRFIVDDRNSTHPSDFERALYYTGFLVEKGIDINAYFREWYNSGRSFSCQNLFFGFPRQEISFEQKMFAQAYHRWHRIMERSHNEHFAAWKVQKQAELTNKTKSVNEQKKLLYAEIYSNLRAINDNRTDDPQLKVTTVSLYNLLRELSHQKPIFDFSDIDNSWLKDENKRQFFGSFDERYQGKEFPIFSALMDLCFRKEHKMDTTVLNLYNYIRHKSHKNLAKSYREIDHAWVDTQYSYFLNEKFKKWQSALTDKSRFALTINGAVNYIEKYYKILPKVPSKFLEQHVLEIYNFLRGAIHIHKIDSFSEIDEQWMNEVREEAQKCIRKPTIEQIYSFQQAQQELGTQEKIQILSSNHEVFGTIQLKPTPSVYLSTNLDYNQQLFNCYKIITVMSYEKKYDTSCPHEDNKELRVASELIDYYVGLGKETFDRMENKLGDHMREILQKTSTFWLAPEDNEKYKEESFSRKIAYISDLSTLNSLYVRKKLLPILQKIDILGYSRYYDEPFVVASGDTGRIPSDTERALYMAGFLADKGIDVSAIMKSWQLRGQCISVESQVPLFPDVAYEMESQKNPGAQAFLAAYNALQQVSTVRLKDS